MKPPADALVLSVRSAPKKAPCPHCGQLGRRARQLQRFVRTLAYQQIAFLRITYGEYRCGCGTSFRTHPDGVLPKHHYDNKVRQAVLDHVLDSGLNVEATLRALRRDFCLELSPGFVYDCLHAAARALDLAAHRRQVLARFSGTLCVDEIHLGRFTLLLATDPLGDFPVAFALVSRNDQEHMRRFLGNLQTWGLVPAVVVTDGSNLYPAVLAELWPTAEHQLCVFHILKDINDRVLGAVKRLRQEKARQGKGQRKRGPGRPRKGARRRRGPTAQERAHFAFQRRHLIVKRRERLTEREAQDLGKLLSYVPQLAPLRRFMDEMHALLSEGQSEEAAWARWRQLQSERAFRTVPELVEALGVLRAERFGKVVAYLRRPVGQRVRTNNHVERVNRRLRYWEKVRYKWRRRRSLVRFVVLVVAALWQEKFRDPPGGQSGGPAARPGEKGKAAAPAAETEPEAATRLAA